MGAAMRDLLLQLDTYPDPTSSTSIDQAIGFAATLGGVLSAIAVEVIIEAPTNRLADYLIGLSRLAEDEERKSRNYCVSALEGFAQRAEEVGVLGDVIHGRSNLYNVGPYVANLARTRDLCIVPVSGPGDGQRSVVEAVVFGSGRPVVTFRPGTADLPDAGLALVVIAWDGSRTSARAIADALPTLKKADKVRVLTVTGEKPSASSGLGKDVQRHLQAHGIHAVVDEVDAGNHKIGQVLENYVDRVGADLLVMGAYGQSRAREFILGGATDYILQDAKVPLMLSH
jgi:nucleotide-binding universal stress UspA family protein